MTHRIFKIACFAAFVSTGTIAAAESAATQASTSSTATIDPQFAQFAPRDNPVGTRIDYSIWDEALEYFVLRMGRSIREGAPRPDPGIGSKIVYGHDSRYRLEGNRVIFEYMTDEVTASLTEYRQDLERTADLVNIPMLSRNEQLAFWINLHNAAVIEQVALAYPVSSPSRIRLGGGDLPLDETKFITVSNVKMSPKDIRTKIIFPNWDNPKVIYGFFRGEIGGPSIQREAYKASNVSELLDDSAKEFVNSLRGTQKFGSTLEVSRIYEEARPFYFPDWPNDLTAHLRVFADDEVKVIIDKTDGVRANIYETDIADLAKGETDPNYSNVVYSDDTGEQRKDFGLPTAIARLMAERSKKIEKIIRRGDRVGTVTVIPIDLPGDLGKPEEVE